MKIILIPCVAPKLQQKTRAENLYQSTFFKRCLSYAKKQQADKIFILSALHHLLPLDKEIEPYNVTLCPVPIHKRTSDLVVLSPEQRVAWGKKVLELLAKEADLDNDEFVILANKQYQKPMVAGLRHCSQPLEGLPYGEKLLFLKNNS